MPEELPPPAEQPENKIEQTPEQILAALESAIEKQSRAELTVVDLDGKTERTAIVEPMEIEGDIGWVGTEQAVMPLELNRIKKVEVEMANPSPEEGEKLENVADQARLEEDKNSEKINGLKAELESKFEKLPTKEEVLAIMGISLENCVEPPRELEDESGLYFLEAKVKGEKEGEVVEYMYNRKGEFSTHKSSGTSIYETVYDKDGDFVKYPEHIAEYNPDTGEWKNVR